MNIFSFALFSLALIIFLRQFHLFDPRKPYGLLAYFHVHFKLFQAEPVEKTFLTFHLNKILSIIVKEEVNVFNFFIMLDISVFKCSDM